MSEVDAPDHEAAATGKKQFSSKLVSGIARSGGKFVSGGGSLMSEIANSGGKVVSSGGKAFHKISSPIENAVRKTVDRANDTLHGNSSHSTSSAKARSAAAADVSTKEVSSAVPEDETGKEEKSVSEGGAFLEEKIVVETSAVNNAGSEQAAQVESGEEAQSDSQSSMHGGLLGKVESVTNKLIVSPVKGVAHKVTEGGNKLVVSPVKGASKKVADGGRALFHTNSKGASREILVEEDKHDEDEDEDLADVPPDATLPKMNIIINKLLKNVSIPNYHDIVWSEGDGTSNPPVYGPWLKASGKESINVGEWEFADEGTDFLGDWDGEMYSQKRIVTFVFNKQIPFQIGPTLAKVKHTQYCRVEGKDKCVVAMTIEMKDVPYSDCFNVEIRWVATRSGKNDVAIQVGLFVNFIKSTIMAGKIRSGTTEQTTQQQVELFRTIKKACGTVSEEIVEEPKKEGKGGKEEDAGSQDKCTTWISKAFPLWRKDALANRNDEIAVSAKSANKKMKEVMTVLSHTDPDEADPLILDQLVIVNDALDKILSA